MSSSNTTLEKENSPLKKILFRKLGGYRMFDRHRQTSTLIFTHLEEDYHKNLPVFPTAVKTTSYNYGLVSGMSEIRDRAQAAPVKSRKFRDNGLPVSG